MNVYELPKDLQEVYDKLRLSEKDQEIIDSFLETALIALHEPKDGRKSDNKALDIKGQLRLIRDKCPDIFPLIDMSELGYCPNNYGMEVADEENCCSNKETCNPCFFKGL